MTVRTFASLTLVCLLVTACATVSHKNADKAFERGDFVTAAELYDVAVREKPSKESLLARRWEARSKAIAELADKAEGQRAAQRTEVALASVRVLAETRNLWFSGSDRARLSEAEHKRVEALSAWAVETVSSTIRVALDSQKPLLARAALQKGRGQFKAGGFGPRADELEQEITAAGLARCAELKAGLPEDSAHLAHWVAEYCSVFGAEQPSVPAAREQVSALKIAANRLAPTTDAQRERLETTLERALLASAWFHVEASGLAPVRIGGTHNAVYSKEAEKRQANWIEKVPYQVQESYQESYQETQHYTDRESHTTYRSESYSCGYGSSSRTCTRSVPHTEYRSVPKTRMVTKYRTKYRTVTRYRDEPRIFHYDATEHRGHYTAAWDIELSLGGVGEPLHLEVRGETHQSSDEHQVSFVPAAISPQKAVLMTHDAWFTDRLRLLEKELPARLRKHWLLGYCGAQAMGEEEAARCARGARSETPAQATSVLSAFVRDDAAILVDAR